MLFFDGMRIGIVTGTAAVRPDYKQINNGGVRVVLPTDLKEWADQFKIADEDQERQTTLFINDESDNHMSIKLGIASVANAGVKLEEAQQQPGGVLMLCMTHKDVEALHCVLGFVIAHHAANYPV